MFDFSAFLNRVEVCFDLFAQNEHKSKLNLKNFLSRIKGKKAFNEVY